MTKYVTLISPIQKIVQRGATGPPGDAVIQRGGLNLTATEDTVCVDVEMWYNAAGVYTDGNSIGFTTSTDGLMTHTGALGVFLLNGVSDLAVDKASKITYALFVDDVLFEKSLTPHDFTAAAKTQSIGITGIEEIANGATLRVKMKSDTASTTVTVDNLRFTIWGGY